jgi:hypothetical protein
MARAALPTDVIGGPVCRPRDHFDGSYSTVSLSVELGRAIREEDTREHLIPERDLKPDVVIEADR